MQFPVVHRASFAVSAFSAALTCFSTALTESPMARAVFGVAEPLPACAVGRRGPSAARARPRRPPAGRRRWAEAAASSAGGSSAMSTPPDVASGKLAPGAVARRAAGLAARPVEHQVDGHAVEQGLRRADLDGAVARGQPDVELLCKVPRPRSWSPARAAREPDEIGPPPEVFREHGIGVVARRHAHSPGRRRAAGSERRRGGRGRFIAGPVQSRCLCRISGAGANGGASFAPRPWPARRPSGSPGGRR